jgi:iron complex outermembrane recepter protein
MSKKQVLVAILAAFPILAFADSVSQESMIEIGPVTVTGTREAQKISETPNSVSVIKEDTIQEMRPSHPSEIMGKVPGVAVTVTNGEGHQTSIRQPISTRPVYLFLEDGIPTRSTGFFNHNALFEINLPQSAGIEVIKGPASALYGSDAIGGLINVLSRPSPAAPELEANVELGEHGWKRLLLTGGTGGETWGVRPSANLTHTDGWRDDTAYTRRSFSLRWDQAIDDDTVIKTLLSTADIDQQSAGSTRLNEEDYRNNPKLNYIPISYRKVKAVRLSSAYEKSFDSSLVSITPYLRYNEMDQLPNYVGTSPFSTRINTSRNYSIGLQAKYRQDFAPMRTRLIVGVDVDRSPGSFWERGVAFGGAEALASGATRYTSFTVGDQRYDYDVTYTGVAPYVHTEFSPFEPLRVTAGLRYDNIKYDYDNNLDSVQTGSIRRPKSTEVDFDNVSAKLGATWQFNQNHNMFANYTEGFRAPSEGQLFRQGSSVNTVDLDPIQARNIELGFRGQVKKLSYAFSIFDLEKTDDILTFLDPVSGDRLATNNGTTTHRGVELGLSAGLTDTLILNGAFSYIKHEYNEWIARVGGNNVDFSGNEIENAPRFLGNISLDYKPSFLNGGAASVEWVKMGSYRIDQANTAGQKYNGHNLINLRASYFPTKTWEIYGRVMNVADKRYAESAAFRSGERQFAPGLPRTGYIGAVYRWDAK